MRAYDPHDAAEFAPDTADQLASCSVVATDHQLRAEFVDIDGRVIYVRTISK